MINPETCMKCLVMTIVICLSLISSCCIYAAGSQKDVKTFDVAKYGAIANGTTDSGPAIRRAVSDAIKSGAPAEVRLGPGRYLVGGVRGENAAVPIKNAKDLTISGVRGKTELIVTNPEIGGISISDSENVVVKDLVLDYDPLPFTQGRVVAVDSTNGVFELKLDDGFPLLSAECFIKAPSKCGMIYDSQKPMLKPGAPDFVFLDDWTKCDGNVWRIKLTESERSKISYISIKDRFVLVARPIASHGVVFWNCKNAVLENVTIYASLAAATVFGLSEGFTVSGLSVRIRPNSSRLLSTNADGIHCLMNRSGLLIEKCYFEGMGDDAINLYTPPYVVKKVISPTEILVTNGSNTRKGDMVQVLNPKSGRIIGVTTIAETKPSDGNTLLKLKNAVNGIKAGIDHRDSDTVFNLSACGQNYIIRKNRFGIHRGRQILLRAVKGLIQDNILGASGSCGIAIYNEPDWPEGPVPSDIKIIGNKFTGSESYPYGAAMQITPMKLGYALAEGRGIHNIEIKNNTFTNVGIMYIAGVSGARITNNKIKADADDKHQISSGLITFEDCDGIVIDGLNVADSRPDAKSAVEVRAKVDPRDKGFTIRNLKTKGVGVVDQRVGEKH